MFSAQQDTGCAPGAESLPPMQFGIAIIGTPGSGKSTLCHTLADAFTAIRRPHTVVNMDPANEGMTYQPDIDIRDLVSLADVAAEYGLGPNGALQFCLDFLAENVQWLLAQLARFPRTVFLFDLPGQCECYTAHTALKTVFNSLCYTARVSMVSLHLVEAAHIGAYNRYLSVALVALMQQMMLDLPALHAVSKYDLCSPGGLGGPVDAADDALREALLAPPSFSDLSADALQRGLVPRRMERLTAAVSEILDSSFCGVSFMPVSAGDPRLVRNLIVEADRVVGYDPGCLGEYAGASRTEVEAVRQFLYGE